MMKPPIEPIQLDDDDFIDMVADELEARFQPMDDKTIGRLSCVVADIVMERLKNESVAEIQHLQTKSRRVLGYMGFHGTR